MPKRWVIAPRISAQVEQALQSFSPLLRQLLFNRGVTDEPSAIAFLSGAVTHSTDPLLLKDMCTAVNLLHGALLAGKKIAIYGDYDVDGVTSSALLFEFLEKMGCNARVYIPNRFDEGYGLNVEAVSQLISEGIQLIITVDCGIRSVREISLAEENGVPVILTDHHLPGEELPPASAILNARQPGDVYPYKHLAGVGMAYKLVAGYLEQFPQEGLSADDWLDLVALGTIADVAPLTGENRSLVMHGLNLIRGIHRQGLFSLAQVSGLKLERINAGNIGFGLGPRLNAAGRLDSAIAAFDLLTSRDLFQAALLAQQLESQNSQRKEIVNQIQARVVTEALASVGSQPIIFSASPDFNEGVVGLVASRITEAFYRPAIIGHYSDQTVVASCRSIAEFNIANALDQCEDLLLRHGGHSMAAGFTVRHEHLPELLERLNGIARQSLDGLELIPKLAIDAEIKLSELSGDQIPAILEDMALLEPTGTQNPEPLFYSGGLHVLEARPVGNGQHLKLRLRAGRVSYDAIAFNQGHWLDQLSGFVDIAYIFELNTYMGRETLQLRVKEIRPAQT